LILLTTYFFYWYGLSYCINWIQNFLKKKKVCVIFQISFEDKFLQYVFHKILKDCWFLWDSWRIEIIILWCEGYFIVFVWRRDPIEFFDSLYQVNSFHYSCLLFYVFIGVYFSVTGCYIIGSCRIWWLFTASAPRLSEVIIVPKDGYQSHKE